MSKQIHITKKLGVVLLASVSIASASITAAVRPALFTRKELLMQVVTILKNDTVPRKDKVLIAATRKKLESGKATAADLMALKIKLTPTTQALLSQKLQDCRPEVQGELALGGLLMRSIPTIIRG